MGTEHRFNGFNGNRAKDPKREGQGYKRKLLLVYKSDVGSPCSLHEYRRSLTTRTSLVSF